MSRLNPTNNVENPIKEYLEWKGTADNGRFDQRIKGAEGEESRIESHKELAFMVMETRHSVVGFDEASEKYIFANDVSDVGKNATEVLHLKTTAGKPIASGTYQELKPQLKGLGCKYAVMVYAFRKCLDGERGISKITLAGTGSGAWFRLCEENNVDEGLIVWDGTVEKGKKGATSFDKPIFTKTTVSEEVEAECTAALPALEKYLSAYAQSKAAKPEPAPEPELVTAGAADEEDPDYVPF